MPVPTNDKSLSENTKDLAEAVHDYKENHGQDANAHGLASQTKAGFMSPLDKAKLDSLDNGGVADGSVTVVKLADNLDLGGLS